MFNFKYFFLFFLLFSIGPLFAYTEISTLNKVGSKNNIAKKIISSNNYQGGNSRMFSPNLRQEEFIIDTTLRYASLEDDQVDPVVIFADPYFFVTWIHKEACDKWWVRGTRVTSNGKILEPNGIQMEDFFDQWNSTRYENPSAASSNASILVVGTWSFYRPENGEWTPRDIKGVLINLITGEIWNRLEICSESNEQKHPTVASDSSNFLVVWEDYRNSSEKIYGTPIYFTGGVVYPDGIPLFPNEIYSPSLSYGGDLYLLCGLNYQNGRKILAGRIMRNGQIVDSSAFTVYQGEIRGKPYSIFDGENFWIFWKDYMQNDQDIIKGCRITPSGEILDPDGINICSFPSFKGSPEAGLLNNQILVVWKDEREGEEGAIYGTRVTTSGEVLDPDGIPLYQSPYIESDPKIAAGGEKYLLSWIDSRNPTLDIYGKWIENLNNGIERQKEKSQEEFPISVTSNEEFQPAISYGDGHYTVVWTDVLNNSSDLYGLRLTVEGEHLDSIPIPIAVMPGNQRGASIAQNDQIALVIFSERRDVIIDTGIYEVRINKNGEVIDSVPISLTNMEIRTRSIKVVSNGENFLLVFTSGGAEILGIILSSSGEPVGPYPFFIGYGERIGAGTDGRDYFVVWDSEEDYSQVGILGTRITNDGVVLEPGGFPIAIAHLYAEPDVAGNDSLYCVVWRSEGINAVIVDSSGQIITSPILIDDGEYYERFPIVTYDGENFVVGWYKVEEYNQNLCRGAYITPYGSILGYFTISNPPFEITNLDVASTGSGSSFFILSHKTLSPYNSLRTFGFIPSLNKMSIAQGEKRRYNFSILAYPNPFNEALYIKLLGSIPKEKVSLVLFDVSGRVVRKIWVGPLTSNEKLIKLSTRGKGSNNLPTGIYFLKTEGANVPTIKLVKLK